MAPLSERNGASAVQVIPEYILSCPSPLGYIIVQKGRAGQAIYDNKCETQASFLKID